MSDPPHPYQNEAPAIAEKAKETPLAEAVKGAIGPSDPPERPAEPSDLERETL